jgi:hypothetical protein
VPFDCNACDLGNHKNAPFPSIPKDKLTAKRPGQKIIHDITGKARTRAIGSRAVYQSHIACEYSNHWDLRMIRTKDQAVKHIQDFCVESELKHNNKVEQIQTDNAGETFHSHAYREWCTKNNIKFVANVPEMHGSMGKIDKAIQDSSRSTIIMLLFSNLTPGFWALAAKYHAHTREFIPSLGSATGLPPVMVWNKLSELPNISHMLDKPFGCDAIGFTLKKFRS